ncbi:MAG TPA: response regulator, partial [Nitrospira sp.]|nr:response regulator [Nitrospira sp.]
MSETSVNVSKKMPWSMDMADSSALTEIPAHILLVDDDPGILSAMASLLEGPGRTVLTAKTGQSALRHLLRHDCAVIVLDVRMPQMDGFELATLIRQRDRSRFTPIIFLSGVDTMDADVVRGLSSGAVDYLVKPVLPDVLQHKVDAFVELFRLREWAQQQAR